MTVAFQLEGQDFLAIAMRIPTLPAGGAVEVRPVEHVTAVG